MTRNRSLEIKVNRRPNGCPYEGLLHFRNQSYPCLLGRSGITTNKKEGDGATPAGKFRLLFGFFRHDRITLPANQLSFHKIKPADGWCDSPSSPNYNSPIKLPFTASHEIMMREDRLYNVCIVMDYNISEKRKGKGSAIFFHITSPVGKPTEGCVALSPEHMQKILPFLNDQITMTIRP